MGKAGKKKKKKRKIIKADATVKIVSIPKFFAPSQEKCTIRYSLKRKGESIGKMAKLEIKDKEGKRVYYSGANLGIGGDGEFTINWDGKDEGGKYVTPLQSPFTVLIAMTNKPGIKHEKKLKVEIKEIFLWVDAPDSRLLMNDPAGKICAVTTVMLKKSDGSKCVTRIPIDVSFTFSDPAPNNTKKADSFEYDTATHKYLGKRNDPNATFWAAHPDCTALTSSPDSYKTKCKVGTITSAGADCGKAKVYFTPSGVGKDNFKLKAEVFAADGTTVLSKKDTGKFTVWRKIHYAQIYTMDGENYIDAATTHAKIGPAYEAKAYVLYSRAAVKTLNANLTVKYIGLYKTGGGMKNWPADFSPQKLESTPNELQPTATELTDYAGADAVKKAAAKTAIEAKAAKWFSAIVADYNSCVSKWFTAANVPAGNTLLAVKYYHPKLSGLADGATNFWPAGISINLANPGSGLNTPGDPDQATWREVQGFNRGTISVIFKNYGTAARLQIVCRHEIGHATKSAFKRDTFGVGDHSASGLMTPYGASNTFSNADIKILRGFKR